MKILYEDSSVIVCMKEAGLPVQSADYRKMDLESILKNRIKEESGSCSVPYLGIINRLDQPVRGLVLTAKTKEAAAGLSIQLSDGRIKKTYLALVWKRDGSEGAVPEEKVLEDCLIRVKGSNLSRVAEKGESGAKRALLRFRAVDDREMEAVRLLFPEYISFLEAASSVLPRINAQAEGVFGTADQVLAVRIDLITGRHHQIRVQMAHAGLPVLGDRKYAPDIQSVLPPEARFPALAAWEMEFVHPKSGKTIRVNAEGKVSLG